VLNDIGRPDLGFIADGGDNRAINAVLASTLAMHQVDNFWKDIVASDVVFDAGAYIQTLDRRTMPRFRSIAYFRKWDPTFSAMQLNPTILPPIVNSDLALKHLEIVDLGTGGIFDSYGSERQDVCYAAGDTIFIKSSTLLTQGKIGYYARPHLDIENSGVAYNSWIAREHPWAIIYHAEAALFTTTGDLDRARELVRPAIPARDDPGGLVAQAIAALKMDNIELGGR
jgi:hypothetical protein